METNKIILSNIKNITKIEAEQIKPQDVDAVREIILGAENNFKTYQSLKHLKENTIDKKIKKDDFKYGYALQGVKNIIDMYIKYYIKQYCSTGTKINNFLNNNDRLYIYNYFLVSWLEKEF